MFSEYEALLRGILESPEDDAPRLVLSDWLEEQGEDERAKAIRRAIQNDEPSKCSFIDRNGVQHISTRGFISSVSLTCEVFVGGQCETCKGLGWPDFASYNARNFRRDFAPPCYKCRGTGRIEGVAKELFQQHPILSVKITDADMDSDWCVDYGRDLARLPKLERVDGDKK